MFIKIRNKLDLWINHILMGHWSNLLSKTIESITINCPEIVKKKYKVSDPQIIHYNFPSGFSSFFRPYRYFEARYVYILKNIIFLKIKGAALTSDFKIIQESYGSLKRLYVWDDIKPYLSCSYLTLGNLEPCYYLPPKNFYHFLIEELPAILHAEKNIKELKILVTRFNDYPKYYQEVLTLWLGHSKKDDKLKEVYSNTKVKNGVITKRAMSSGGVLKQDIDLLNKIIFPKVNVIMQNTPAKIYISRKLAKKRRIVNEDKIEKLVKKYGYTVLYMEQMSFSKQVNYIAYASHIIAPHGAGLSHLVWNPGLKKNVLEIFPANVKNDCFATLAMTLHHNYDYIVCKKDDDNLQICNIETLNNKIKTL